jgi:hypothetical protein
VPDQSASNALSPSAGPLSSPTWRSSTAVRTIIVAAAAAACLYVFAARHTMPDFEVYWRAGERASEAEPLYQRQDGHYQFKYFPAFAVLALPLGTMPIEVARAIWFALSFSALCLVLRLSVRLLPDRRKPVWLLVAATILVMAKFFARELMLGQVNYFFLAASLGAVLFLGCRRDAAAGGLAVLAVILKPYGVLLIPWMLAHRRVRLFGAAAAGTAAAVLAPSAVYGAWGNVSLHQAWWDTVVTTTAPNLLGPDNASWLAMYSRLFGAGLAAWVMTSVTLAIVAGAFVSMWRARRHVPAPDALEGALLLTLIPLTSPQGWDYGLLVSAPAVMLVVNYHGQLPRLLQWLSLAAFVAIGLSIYDLLGRENYMRFMNASGVTISYFVVIAALMAIRRRRLA